MTAVAYIDAQRVEPRDVDAAERRSAAVVARPDSSIASPDVAVRTTTVPSTRSEGFRSAFDRRLGTGRLVELARYDLLGRLAPYAHAAGVVEALLDEHGEADEVVWVAGAGALIGAAHLDALRGSLAACGVRLDVVGDPAPAATGVPRRSVASRELRRFTREVLAAAKRRGADPPRADVVVVEAYHQGARRSVEVVAELDRRAGIATAVWVTNNRAAAPFEDRAMNAGEASPRRVRVFAAVSGAVASYAGRRWLRRTAAAWPRTGSFVAEVGAEAASSAWREAARWSVLGRRLVGASRAAVVVSSTDGETAVRAVLDAARRAGKPRVFLQHGLLLLPPYRRHFVHSHFLVWGERDREELAAAGVGGGVIVTGSSEVERLQRHEARPFGERFVVAYFPSRTNGRFVSDEVGRYLLHLVVDGAGRAGATLVVKVHPNDRSGIFDDVPGDVEVLRAVEPVKVMVNADAVVAVTSTAGLEACVVGRPLVVLQADGIGGLDDCARHGAALEARTAEELATALLDIRDQRAGHLVAGRAALVDHLFAGAVPGAASRSADAILTAAGALQ